MKKRRLKPGEKKTSIQKAVAKQRAGIFLKKWDNDKQVFVFQKIKRSEKDKLIVAYKGMEYAIYPDADGVLILKSKGDSITSLRFSVPTPNAIHLE